MNTCNWFFLLQAWFSLVSGRVYNIGMVSVTHLGKKVKGEGKRGLKVNEMIKNHQVEFASPFLLVFRM
jgi:hypothetical protein